MDYIFKKFAEHLLAFSRLASIQQHPSPFYTSIRRSIRFRHPRTSEKPPATDPSARTLQAPHRPTVLGCVAAPLPSREGTLVPGPCLSGRRHRRRDARRQQLVSA